jgi:hypothetical protein
MFYKPALKLTQSETNPDEWYYGTWIIRVRYEEKLNIYRSMGYNKVGWKRWLRLATNDGRFSAANSAALQIDIKEGREGNW